MSSNVYTLPVRRASRTRPTIPELSSFDDLTDALLLARAEAGTLDPGIVAALLAAVRQPGRECSR